MNKAVQFFFYFFLISLSHNQQAMLQSSVMSLQARISPFLEQFLQVSDKNHVCKPGEIDIVRCILCKPLEEVGIERLMRLTCEDGVCPMILVSAAVFEAQRQEFLEMSVDGCDVRVMPGKGKNLNKFLKPVQLEPYMSLYSDKPASFMQAALVLYHSRNQVALFGKNNETFSINTDFEISSMLQKRFMSKLDIQFDDLFEKSKRV